MVCFYLSLCSNEVYRIKLNLTGHILLSFVALLAYVCLCLFFSLATKGEKNHGAIIERGE